jgi:hypothetical protein
MKDNLYFGHDLECNYKNNCVGVVKQIVEVNTPVSLEAIANINNTKVDCGEPKICSFSKPNCYHDNKTCEFTIKQTLCVEIPISYQIKTKAGNSYMECNKKDKC